MPPKATRAASKRRSTSTVRKGKAPSSLQVSPNVAGDSAAQARSCSECAPPSYVITKWASLQPTWRYGLASLVVTLFVVFASTMVPAGTDSVATSPSHPHPCAPCAVKEFAKGNRLAAALMRRPGGVSAIHVTSSEQLTRALQPLRACVSVTPISSRFDDVATMADYFRESFKNGGGQRRCQVWIVELETIRGVNNALKELLEDNTLRGEMVVPRGARGLLVLVSPLSREGLKGELQHRVVHMMSSISL